jgi:hypothetical protein
MGWFPLRYIMLNVSWVHLGFGEYLLALNGYWFFLHFI